MTEPAKKAPVEAKVAAASTTALLASLVSGLASSSDVKTTITAGVVAIVSAGATFVVGWLTKHTPRA